MATRGGVEEEERLLEGSGHDEKAPSSTTQPVKGKVSWKNLPEKKQLLLLALCRLSTPLSNSCLLPYLYFLVQSILSDPDHPSAPQEISRLTGLLVAAYPIGQMSTSMLWGRVSDTYGRKPVILLGLLISVVANLAFGFSRSIGLLLFWRVLAGMANGILGVMRTMTAEIVERRFQTRAFLALPLVFNSGRVAALVIGGCLADPVHNLSWLFGPTGVFNVSDNPDGVSWAVEYPYALPSLFNGIILAICLVLATLWLRETLPERDITQDFRLLIGKTVPRSIQRRFFGKDSGYVAVQGEDGDVLAANVPDPGAALSYTKRISCGSKAGQPPFSGIWTRPLLKTLAAFGMLPLHNATFLHIFPVFLSMPTTASDNPTFFRFTGGLGLASPTVGIYLATFGICGILLQLFIYPRVQKHLGTLGMLRLANFIFPIAYIFAPYLSLLAHHDIAKWPAMAAVLFSQVMARTMAIPSTVLLLTEAAPRRSVLGTVHGAGNTLSALGSAAGPVVGGVILARGIDAGAVGIVWWCWLLVVAIAALAWSFVLRPNEADEEPEQFPLE